jgi:hypothetical protein
MDVLVVLAGAALLIALGSLVLLVRHREPKGDHYGIRQFQREMQALSPEARKSTVEAAGVRIVRQPEQKDEE